MGTHETLKGRLQRAVLLTLALSMLALVGCGDTPQAPLGAVMTIELYNTIPGTTNAGVNRKVYRVTMKDSAGIPLNGLKVNLYGTFTAGNNINLAGAVGTVPVGGVASLNSSIELNGAGIQDFFLDAPTTNTIPIPTPVITGLTELSGGSLIFGTTYRYVVTALDAQTPTPGQTARSTTSQIVSAQTGTGNAVQITWTPVIGASAYNVYGCDVANCTPALTDLLATVPTSTTVYIDRTNTGGGVTAQAFGSSGIAVNTVRGTIDVQSGGLYQLLDVSLP